MKKRIIIILSIVLIILIGYRIKMVNQDARLPEYEYYDLNEAVEYKGFNYTVTEAVMMDYDDFFRENQEYIQYYNSDGEYEKKVIIVHCKIEKNDDTAVELETYIPIRYEYMFNGFDPALFSAMNPDLVEGNFKSGDEIVYMYEIYESNMSETEWEKVEEMDYSLVFGVYPVRKEIRLDNIEYR